MEIKVNESVIEFFPLFFCHFAESGAVVTDAITSNDNETAAGNVITLGTPDIVAGAGNTISPNSVPPPPPYGPSNTPQTYIQVNDMHLLGKS